MIKTKSKFGLSQLLYPSSLVESHIMIIGGNLGGGLEEAKPLRSLIYRF